MSDEFEWRAGVYEELTGLANSLDDAVTTNDVVDKLHQLANSLHYDTRLAGETELLPEGQAAATPGHFAARWNNLPEEQRYHVVDSIRASGDTALRCIIEDHEGFIRENALAPRLTEAEVNTLAQRMYESEEIDCRVSDLFEALTTALGHIGVNVVSATPTAVASVSHEDCAECGKLVEVARTVLDVMPELPEYSLEAGPHAVTLIRT